MSGSWNCARIFRQSGFSSVTDELENVTGSLTDVRDREAVDELFADVHQQLGGLDVLVDNAGIAGPTAPVELYDADAWDAVIGVNLTGTFLVTQRAIPMLREAGARLGLARGAVGCKRIHLRSAQRRH